MKKSEIEAEIVELEAKVDIADHLLCEVYMKTEKMKAELIRH